MSERSHSSYKVFSLGLALIFAAVGADLLVLPRETLAFFNAMSRRPGNGRGAGRTVVLRGPAGGYMYVVTVLAWLMYRSPREKI